MLYSAQKVMSQKKKKPATGVRFGAKYGEQIITTCRSISLPQPQCSGFYRAAHYKQYFGSGKWLLVHLVHTVDIGWDVA